MALLDHLTDAAATGLASHTSDSGHTYTDRQSAANLQINNNRVNATTSADHACFFASWVPATADYWVQGLYTVGASSNVSPCISGRADTSSNIDYFVRWNNGSWELFSEVTGTETSLGTYTGDVPTTTRTVRLDMVGTTIRVLIDGVERINVTNSAIASAGRAGLSSQFSDASSTRYIDDLEADDAVGESRPVWTWYGRFPKAVLRRVK